MSRDLAGLHFPGAIQIVDLYHARQHLWNVARLLYPGDELRQKRWILRHQPKLDKGKIKNLVGYLRSLHPASPELAETIRKEAEYFQRNAKRMRYPEFRLQHLFVGSGVIEAGCKNRHRQPPEAVRDVLDGARGQRHHCSSLLSSQKSSH